MSQYDFFIAGRWRNKDMVSRVLDAVRASGKTAYCFIENEYTGQAVEFKMDENPDTFMKQAEALALDDPLIRTIFETDMAAQRAADMFLLVFPAGSAAHMEAGAAYGMGKKCYAVGRPEKTETLYSVFDTVFPDVTALEAWLRRS
jgi:hypothetical protein